jgi:hypothetical protein
MPTGSKRLGARFDVDGLQIMLGFPRERSGRQGWPDSRTHGRAFASAAKDASPITRRACRTGKTRERKEGYSDSGEARQQRSKARKRCLVARGLVRLSIQQPLSLCGGEQGVCPFPVAHIADVRAEIETCQIPEKVRLADVVERTVDAPFEQCEMAFHRLRVTEAARPNVLLIAMVDRTMAGELAANADI